ncbi:ParA family protein [Franconibacter pulveris 1160]|uniref:ParA family protein n=1 Tax=Franconibacter pulveris TaxID=435910 RepID=UPI0004639BEE|nr:ParA family protein [Franconibacter pulveris]
MSSLVENVLKRYAEVVEDGYVVEGGPRFKSYAVSNLRGGVGKSTMSFNLAYEISRKNSLLVADLCPQCNLTETILKGAHAKVTIANALTPKMLGPAFGDMPEDISYRVSSYIDDFKGGKACFAIPGDPELFAFPSSMYQQLQVALSRGEPKAVRTLLTSLHSIMNEEAKDKKCEILLMDTSPFYAGGTHLAWCAADALIIPVRVDEHSIESLNLTLDMLSNKSKDFNMWNDRAGGLNSPKIAAIVMTMAGSKSQLSSTPGKASQMYIERAVKLAEKHRNLFVNEDISNAIVVTDDFVSSGQISGAESIPISQLKVGRFHTVSEGKRLQVNKSVTRYQRQLRYLASIL